MTRSIERNVTSVGHRVLYIVLLYLFSVIPLTGAAHAELIDRVVAVVNDDIISLFELNRMLAPYVSKIKSLNYPPDQELAMLQKVREDILNQLIDQKLTDQESARARISVSPEEVAAALKRVRKAQGYTEAEMAEALQREGFTPEEYRNRLKEQILRSKLVSLRIKSKIVITEEDVRTYYEEHEEDYEGGKKYHLRNIVLRVSPFADDEEKRAIRKKMRTILKEIKAGQPFDMMARKYSQSSLAEEGGDLGVFPFNKLSPQLQAAVKGLRQGQMSKILDTEQGYQLFYIEKIIKMPKKSLEQATPDIEEKLFNEIVNEKFRTWLTELRKNSLIRILD